jgi:hypothetical protein
MLVNRKKFIATLAFCFAALPAWAAHMDSMDWTPDQPVTIGTTQIQPGDYQLKAEEGKSELQVTAKGKVVATVPCTWTQLPAKAADSEVSTDGVRVTGVQFAGRPSAIQINP